MVKEEETANLKFPQILEVDVNFSFAEETIPLSPFPPLPPLTPLHSSPLLLLPLLHPLLHPL